jgi:diguanylate cyclase (GGDEF)-like protein/PAS domain S-box-containing protein
MRLTGFSRRVLLVGLPLLVLAVSLFITYEVFRYAQQDAERQVRAYFDFRVREAVDHIERRMQAYEQVLRGAAGLFEASDSVEREEYRKYVATLRLEDNYPGIQGVGFSLLVPAAKKESHIAAIRREGFPEYTIRPDGRRDPYSSIIYLEPFADRNLRAFGYDMYSEPVRRAAMQKALDSGEISLSGKVRLVQESGKREQAGFLMYLPIYRNDVPHGTLAERRANAVGWVYAPFRMDDFMGGAQGERASDLDMEIYDGNELSQASLMYDSDNSVFSGVSRDTGYRVTQQLQIADHSWTIHIRSLPMLRLRLDTGKPRVFAVGGVVVSVLFSLLVWMLLTGRERAIKAARAMNEELMVEQRRLSNIIEGTRVGTWEWNIQTGKVVFNRYWANIIGYELEELEPVSIETWNRFTHPDDRKLSEELLKRHFSGHLDHYECETRMRHKDGHWVWVLDRGRVATWTKDGKPLLMFGTHQDITQRKQAEEHILHVAQHDVLTGLPNRFLLDDRLQQALAAARRDRGRLALMFMDMDKFKPINDTYGHDIGDLLLKEAAGRVEECCRASDTVARIGGDEFIVLLPEIEQDGDAMVVAEKMRRALGMPFEIEGLILQVSLSIGIAIYPEHGNNVAELSKHADIAMYRAKQAGRDNVQLYRPEMAEEGESSRG